jgi:hypothetical protein
MGLKRTNVYADEDDLALIKQGAERTGRSEAEIIREAIHRAALAQRVWDEPFVTPEEGLHLGASLTKKDIKDAVVGGYESRRDRNR